MDINGVEKKLDAADGILTKLKALLKKHWGLLIFILFCWCVYWAFTQPPIIEPIQQEYVPAEYVNSDSVFYEDEDTTTYIE